MRVHKFSRRALFFSAIVVFLLGAPSANALSITARVSDQSTEVSGGDRLYFAVEIKYPENPTREDLRIEYQITENGKSIASEKVLRAVETQASFLDYIVVPKSAMSGTHELNVIITDYAGTLSKSVSATFTVLKGADQLTMYFFILLGATLLVAILVVIQIVAARRQK